MNYYLILAKNYTYDDGREENISIYNFLLKTAEELKTDSWNEENVIYSYDEEDNWNFCFEFTKISSIAFEEMKKYLTTRKELT